MTHILHLGHQSTDISGIQGHLGTFADSFDPALDVNGIRFSGPRTLEVPFAIPHPAPTGDLWLGFRYVPPNLDAHRISQASANFLEFLDAANTRVARIRPLAATDRYHAEAHGDMVEQGGSSYFGVSGQAQWVDVRVAVGADITVEFFVDGVLHSTATAPNTAGKGKPVQVLFANSGLHEAAANRTWYYAHIAILDDVPTIGRRFVRRRPDAPGSFAQMIGSVAALADGSIASRVASTAPGQRLSFTLAGPTGPAAGSVIAGVHLKQIAQAGTDGPQATAGFLRMAGVNHDAAPVNVPVLAPATVFSSWATNPADNTPWTSATLPTEVGILSA